MYALKMPRHTPRLITQRFFDVSTIDLARNLLGTYLATENDEGRTGGRIVETEAYLGTDDPASHAFRGKTARNAAMFERAGVCYVYFIYGMYHCFNIVSGKKGHGEAVLIRALEPVEGIPLMQERRGVTALRQLCNGPAKLVTALGISPEHTFTPLTGRKLASSPFPPHATTIRLYETPPRASDSNARAPRGSKIRSYPHLPSNQIVQTTRVGLSVGTELPLRFYVKDSPFRSRP